MTFDHAFDFGFVLNSLQILYDRVAIDYLIIILIYVFVNLVVDLLLIDIHFFIVDCFQIVIKPIIIHDTYSILLQILFHFAINCFFIYKQNSLIFLQNQETEKHRITYYISASKIQQPSNIIQLTIDINICLALYFFPNLFSFLFVTLTTIFQFQYGQ